MNFISVICKKILAQGKAKSLFGPLLCDNDYLHDYKIYYL